MYHGQQYKLPAVIVLPHGFPREAPIVRMTPRAGMVRNERSSCVDCSLRVVGGYIEKWEYPFSSLERLYVDMKEAFGKSPPLRQRQHPDGVHGDRGGRGGYGEGRMGKEEKDALVSLLHRLVNESMEVEYVCLASAMEKEVGARSGMEERLKELREAVVDMEGRIEELGRTNESLTWWLARAEDKLQACRVKASPGRGFGVGRGENGDGGTDTMDAMDAMDEMDEIDAYEAAAPMGGPAREELEAGACRRAVQEAVQELDGALAGGRLSWGGYKRLLSQLVAIKFQARVVERRAASERQKEAARSGPSPAGDEGNGENGENCLDCSSWTYPEVEDAVADEAIGAVDRETAGNGHHAHQDLLGDNPLRRGRFRDMISSSKIFRSMP